jgi:hypothetical protein
VARWPEPAEAAIDGDRVKWVANRARPGKSMDLPPPQPEPVPLEYASPDAARPKLPEDEERFERRSFTIFAFLAVAGFAVTVVMGLVSLIAAWLTHRP